MIPMAEDAVRGYEVVVNELIRGRGDPEAEHGIEDDLLHSFVRELAAEGDNRAVTLARLLDTPRKRWYA